MNLFRTPLTLTLAAVLLATAQAGAQNVLRANPAATLEELLDVVRETDGLFTVRYGRYLVEDYDVSTFSAEEEIAALVERVAFPGCGHAGYEGSKAWDYFLYFEVNRDAMALLNSLKRTGHLLSSVFVGWHDGPTSDCMTNYGALFFDDGSVLRIEYDNTDRASQRPNEALPR